MSNQYNENDIAQFLEQHPEFFKNHIGLLATMYLPNAHGGGTVSLAERQQAAQRDKIREIERKYTELLEIGIENDANINKMHQLALSLLKAATLNETIEALISTLQNEFNVPMLSLKLWTSTNESHEVFGETDETIQAWLETLPEPYCGHEPDSSIISMMDSEARSFAVVPLKNAQIIGVLAMASNEEKRFYPEMGTMLIERIGALVSAAIQKYII